jgi:hypothetical protein
MRSEVRRFVADQSRFARREALRALRGSRHVIDELLARSLDEHAHPSLGVEMSTVNTQDMYQSDNRSTARNASRSTRIWQETKPSPKTTELWFMVAGIAALFVIYHLAADNSLNLWRACVLGTVLAAAYIVSRGFAKAGSHDDHEDTDYVSSQR